MNCGDEYCNQEKLFLQKKVLTELDEHVKTATKLLAALKAHTALQDEYIAILKQKLELQRGATV